MAEVVWEQSGSRIAVSELVFLLYFFFIVVKLEARLAATTDDTQKASIGFPVTCPKTAGDEEHSEWPFHK